MTMAAVLLVDDDPLVLATIGAILKWAGHIVTAAPSGLEALDVLDGDQPIDLMLTDVVMPGLHGFNLARMARIRLPTLKILYLTAFHETATAMRDAGERFGKLLTKPIDPPDLKKEVDAALADALA